MEHMMNIRPISLSILLLIVSMSFGQERITRKQTTSQQAVLTGNFRTDLRQMMSVESTQDTVVNLSDRSAKSKKSPLLAGIYSALLPGAGEYYSEHYWKAGVFLRLS